jgi:hypothetical protein
VLLLLLLLLLLVVVVVPGVPEVAFGITLSLVVVVVVFVFIVVAAVATTVVSGFSGGDTKAANKLSQNTATALLVATARLSLHTAALHLCCINCYRHRNELGGLFVCSLKDTE